MPTIATSQYAVSPTGRDSTGAMWVGTIGTDGTFRIRRSTDEGASWTDIFTEQLYGSGSNSTNVDLAIDEDDNVHTVYTKVANIRMVSLRLTNASTRTYTAYQQSVENRTDGADYYYRGKVAAHRITEGSTAGGWAVHVAYHVYSGYVVHYVWRFDSAGFTYLQDSALQHAFGANNYDNVALAFDWRHAADGRTRSGPAHLFLVAQGINANADIAVVSWRATHTTGNPGTWTWSSRATLWSDVLRNRGDAIDLCFDGSRWVYAVAGRGDGNYRFHISVLDFTNGLVVTDLYAASFPNDATPATINRALFTDGLRMAYDAGGNLYVFGLDLDIANDNTVVCRRLRSGATDFDPPLFSEPASGSSYPYPRRVRLRRAAPWKGRLDFSYGYYNADTNQQNVLWNKVVLNQSPDAATPLSPTASQRVDRTQPIPCSWAFSDPDGGDSQSRADFRYRVGTGAWTTVLNAATTTASYSIPANTFTAETVFGWQSLPYDSQGSPAPGWSTEAFGTAADPTTPPTITAPTNGGTIATASYAPAWSSASQDAYQLRRVADNAGNPNTSVIYADTGVVEDATARSRTQSFDVNNRVEHIQVRVRKGGMWSQYASVRATVSYTPPATPTLALAAVRTRPEYGGTDAIDVTITNPAPTGNQPTVVAHDVFVDDGTGEGLRRVVAGLPAGGVWRHTTPVAGRDYLLGRIRVVAIAANGTTSTASS